MVAVGEFKDGLAFVSKTLYCIIDDKGDNVFLGGTSRFFISQLSYNSKYDAIPGYVFTDEEMKVRKYGLVSTNGTARLGPVFDYVDKICNDDYVLIENYVDGKLRKGIIKIFE